MTKPNENNYNKEWDLVFQHLEENGENNITLDEYYILLDEFLNEFSHYVFKESL